MNIEFFQKLNMSFRNFIRFVLLVSTLAILDSCQAPLSFTPSMIDNPNHDIIGLQLAVDEMEIDMLEMVKLLGYVGADIKIQSSTDLETEEYGQSRIDNHERIIEYDLVKIMDANNALTDPTKRWCSKWLIAHELGHHFHGHLETEKYTVKAEELQSDRFSGFILGMLGANFSEASFFIQNHGSDTPINPDYPPRSQRLESIRLGWEDAQLITSQRQNANGSL